MLPEGLASIINEIATNLSGGEKQKIAIIRLLLQDPDVMIFDEPTSALDYASVNIFYCMYGAKESNSYLNNHSIRDKSYMACSQTVPCCILKMLTYSDMYSFK